MKKQKNDLSTIYQVARKAPVSADVHEAVKQAAQRLLNEFNKKEKPKTEEKDD
jgi:hypothetical protein